MNCFEDTENTPITMAMGVSTALTQLIQRNQARIVHWQAQNVSNLSGMGKEILGYPQVGSGKPSRFDSAYIPEISVEDYVERIQTYSKCSECVYVVAMIYIDRLIEGKGMTVTPLNVHRLFITAILLAAKFYDDMSFKNAFYATLGGIEKEEINLLEVDFLNMIKFSLVVSREEYDSYKRVLMSDPVRKIVSINTMPAHPSTPTSVTQGVYDNFSVFTQSLSVAYH